MFLNYLWYFLIEGLQKPWLTKVFKFTGSSSQKAEFKKTEISTVLFTSTTYYVIILKFSEVANKGFGS